MNLKCSVCDTEFYSAATSNTTARCPQPRCPGTIVAGESKPLKVARRA